MKTINKRLEALENANQGGGFYMVHLNPEDGLYHFLWDERVMNEDEFKAFERSLNPDDYLMVVRRESAKEEEEHV
jgi:hypothetical protein